MRGFVRVFATVGIAAACSSFEDADTPAGPNGGDGGADGATADGGAGDAAVDSGGPSGRVKVATAESPIRALCASSHGVGWTHSASVAGFIDGELRPTRGTEQTGGGCVVGTKAIHFTDPAGIHSVYYDTNPPSEGTVVYSVQTAGPLATDGTVFFTAETTNALRIIETTATPDVFTAYGSIYGKATYITATTSQIFVGTDASDLFRAQRGGSEGAVHLKTLSTLRGLAVSSDTLYVAAAGANEIQKCAVPDCPNLSPVATGLAGPVDVQLSGGQLFWLDRDEGRVKSCKPDDCSAPRIVDTIPNAIHLAVGDRIYVSDQDNVVFAIEK